MYQINCVDNIRTHVCVCVCVCVCETTSSTDKFYASLRSLYSIQFTEQISFYPNRGYERLL